MEDTNNNDPEAYSWRSHPFDDDKLKEECGIFGVFNVKEAAQFVASGITCITTPWAGGCWYRCI